MKGVFPDPYEINSLGAGELAHAVDLLLDSGTPDELKAEFLVALHRRGETAGELAGFAVTFLNGACIPEIARDPATPLLELCGTGGDQAGFLNISTAAMFVAAGAGARVVKHGNRAVSSRCGSADVLEALGVALHLPLAKVGTVLEKAGCVFLLASDFHPAVAAMGPLRRALAAKGEMTIFNLLGPLLNPAYPDFQLSGIFVPSMLELYAEAMGRLGRTAAWAVHGETLDGRGVDELSITGTSRVVSARLGTMGDIVMDHLSIDPVGLGFPRVTTNERLIGSDAAGNAARIESILSRGESGAARDMVVLNAAAAIHIAGIGATLEESLLMASESIDAGRAFKSLTRLREASGEAAV